MSWVWTYLITALAFSLRIRNLSTPAGKVFDEFYYATEAHNILRYGVEYGADPYNYFTIAHPPLGKLFIAMGEVAFGASVTGWRLPAVIAGTLTVTVMIRVARRLFRSTLLGCAAGLLLALDGMEFVFSRLAVLDIFLTLLILLAFACLIRDHEARRELVAAQSEESVKSGVRRLRQWLSVPGWRLGAAIFMGLAISVKWSALWFIPGLLLYVIVSNHGLRATDGSLRSSLSAAWRAVARLVMYSTVSVSVYVASWTGWFLSPYGWHTHKGLIKPLWSSFLPDSLGYFLAYQMSMFTKGQGLMTGHPGASRPIDWLTSLEPYLVAELMNDDCSSNCGTSKILALGTPILWWSFIPALVGCIFLLIVKRDKVAGVFAVTAAVGIFSWIPFSRDMYSFYALPALPFCILAVVRMLACLGALSAIPKRRFIGRTAILVYVAVIGLTFAYFYPLYMGLPLTPSEVTGRMWLSNWK
jgi:dolichyl-phosphate-mannose--protein O-mannosyl transferase